MIDSYGLGFEIVLLKPPAFYTTGDCVSGEVILRIPSALFTLQAKITFRGSARASIVDLSDNNSGGRKSVHTSEITLCSFDQILPPSLRVGLWNEVTAWPFEFTIPSCTQSNLIRKDRYSAHENFHRSAEHDLPPSFKASTLENGLLDGSTSISYTLEASIINPPTGETFLRDLKDSQTILLNTWPGVADVPSLFPIPRLVFSTYGNHVEYGSNPSKEQIDRFQSGLVRRDKVYVVLEAPSKLSMGALLPLKAGIQHALPDPVAKSLLPVRLRGCSVALGKGRFTPSLLQLS